MTAHRWIVRGLLVVGTVLAIVSVFAVWANRQLLNPDNWTDTSTELLADPAVQSQLAAYIVDQVYANVDVTGQVSSALPERAQPLAAPVANGLRDLAERTTTRALARPRIQELWRITNQVTATQLVRVVKGESQVAQITGTGVILDLRPIVLEIAARLGLPNSLVERVPTSAAKITVLEADELTMAQDIAKGLNAIAVVLPILALACLAGAVALARGRRRTVLLWAGIDLIIAGAVVLIVRALAGNAIVDSLVQAESVRPAADAVWSIGTGMLADVAQATIIGGIPLVIAAWLAGPARLAVELRRAAAPWLRDSPALVYGAAVVLVALIVALEPVPATRKVIPVLVMAALLALGIEVLRRQVAREYPDVTADDARARLAGHARSAHNALRGGRRGQAGAGTAPSEADVALLERLATLHDRGVLSDSEFATQKAAVLSQ